MSILKSIFGLAGSAASGPIAPVATLAASIIDRVVPDKAANDAAKAALAQMSLKGELDQIQGQLQVDLAEAQSKSTFVAGWRPAFGWVGAAGLAYEMVIRPLLSFAVHLFGATWVAPSIEIQDLIALCSTMLGFGAMRSYDKAQGTDSGH